MIHSSKLSNPRRGSWEPLTCSQVRQRLWVARSWLLRQGFWGMEPLARGLHASSGQRVSEPPGTESSHLGSVIYCFLSCSVLHGVNTLPARVSLLHLRTSQHTGRHSHNRWGRGVPESSSETDSGPNICNRLYLIATGATELLKYNYFK